MGTSNLPLNIAAEEIARGFEEIIDNKKGIRAIDRLLSDYSHSHVPAFIEPYLKSLYYKSIEKFDKAAMFMNGAISALSKDDNPDLVNVKK